jgi:putative SOS response-associated peptidase YedK
MIERYSITVTAKQIAEHFKVDVPENHQPRYNAAPAQLLPVILLYSKGVSFFYWGEAPQWSKNKSLSEKLINVRAEQIADKPLLQKALKKNRCLIPADGFYAWKKVGKKTMVPYRFTLKTRQLFSIPGFWEEYDDENGEVFHTFTLITCQANTFDGNIAERIPVVFDHSRENIWMNSNSTQEELISTLTSSESERFDHYTIQPRINSANIDDKSLIAPAPSADQFGNLTLFD